MNSTGLLLLLVALATSAQVNIMTSILVNQLPFSRVLDCTDCVQPVNYSAIGLPDNWELDGDTLKATEDAKQGQYFFSVSMVDSANQTANLFVIVVILGDQPSQNGSVSIGGRTYFTLASPRNTSTLAALLLESYSELTPEELDIQKTLRTQAELNTKIGNLLILLRRYTETEQSTTSQYAGLETQLKELLPSQSGLNQEIILNQNKLSRNKNAIIQLLAAIKELRSELANQRQGEGSLLNRTQELNNQLRELLVEKEKLKQSLKSGEQYLNNLTSKENTSSCNNKTIEVQQKLLNESKAMIQTLGEGIKTADKQISDYDKQISQLKNQLAELESKKMGALKQKYENTARLDTLTKQSNSTSALIATLRSDCQNKTNGGRDSAQQVRDNISAINDKIKGIDSTISNTSSSISTLENSLKESASKINFLNAAIDQDIKQVIDFYNQNESIEARLSYLMAEKASIDKKIAALKDELDKLTKSSETNNKALEEVKKMLGQALDQKESSDEAVQQIFLNNLDIIKSVRGQGYPLDYVKLSKLTGLSVQEIQAQRLYQMVVPGVSDTHACSSQVLFYGIGVAEEIDGTGSIRLSGNPADLTYPKCSINFSTKEGHTPTKGDVIVWKGYRADGKWIIIESVMFP